MFFSNDSRIAEVVGKLQSFEYYDVTKPDSDWETRVNAAWYTPGFQSDEFSNDMLSLRDLLLSYGGRGVVLIDGFDPDAAKILNRGILLDGSQYYMAEGSPNSCHSNAAHLWDDNRGRILLCTGYALSQDGLWRQHSWCIDLEEPKLIVETTTPRVAYFGFGLNLDESEQFLYENY